MGHEGGPGRSPLSAGRYCHHFLALPAVPGCSEPLAWEQRLRGSSRPDPARPEELTVSVVRTPETYTLVLRLPKKVLTGFTPRRGEQVGFEYLITDTAHGAQTWVTPRHLSQAAAPGRYPAAGGLLHLTR